MGLVDGKVALVTGASQGIGRQSALAFAREGAKVVVSDVLVEGGQETVKMIQDAGGEAAFVKCDVSNSADVAAAVKFVVDTYGRIDCAHNNAGIMGDALPLMDCTEANWDKTIAINLTGVFLCCKAEVGEMLKQGGGVIVNTASVAGLVGFGNLPAYSSSKHGVNGLTKQIALDYATANIRVNSVCPGVIQTPMIDSITQGDPAVIAAFTATEPVGRLGKPEEIADAAVWLCSDQASFVTGINMPVDGAYIAQ